MAFLLLSIPMWEALLCRYAQSKGDQSKGDCPLLAESRTISPASLTTHARAHARTGWLAGGARGGARGEHAGSKGDCPLFATVPFLPAHRDPPAETHQTVGDIRRYQDLGVDHLGVVLLTDDLSGSLDRIERFMTTVEPLVQ